MTVTYRPAQLNDIPAVAAVCVSASNALSQQRGFQTVEPGPPSPLYPFALQYEPEGFWVAEDNGQVCGFSLSWMRESLWFLAFLFILPSHQGKGIGRTLMERAMEYGRDAGVTHRALITAAYNPVSISLYLRYGMYPREPLYSITCASATLASSGDLKSFNAERLAATQSNIEQLSRLDEHVLGFPRERHHHYLLNAKDATCYVFKRHDRPEGYAYIWPNGRIGPLAVVVPTAFEKVMTAALSLAACQNSAEVSALIAGSNEQAMSIAVKNKMQIKRPSLLMSSKPFGNWSNYLFYGAAFM